MVLKAKCPRCKNAVYIPPCPNCGGLKFSGPGFLGILSCRTCYKGHTYYSCPSCGCEVPASSFGGCFIASEIFGTGAPETTALRAWRDQQLLPSRIGRCVVALYAAAAPLCIRFTHAFPWTRGFLRALIRRVILPRLFVTNGDYMDIHVERIAGVWYATHGSETIQLHIQDDDSHPSTLNNAQLKTFLFKMSERIDPEHPDRATIRRWYSQQ